MSSSTFRAIVPAGGAGTRLWPLSRQDNPKFLHDFTGEGRSLLQTTVDRLAPLADEVAIVTGRRHVEDVREQLPHVQTIFAEPSPRDSMPAIALAAGVLLRRHPREDLVIGSFPADHIIRDVEAFQTAVRAAINIAKRDEVVTIGITPSTASTAFGYIRAGESLVSSTPAATADVRRVEEFVEKPTADVAADYLARGYLWNAGMYVARASVLLGHLEEFHPDLARGIDAIAKAWDTDRQREVLDRVWPTLTRIAIDHAISEPLAPRGEVAVVPSDLGWDDVGDWAAIAQLLERRGGQRGEMSHPAIVLGDQARVLAVDASGTLVVPGDRQIVVVGVDDAVVVDTGDALLVTRRDRAQEVKRAVELLQQRGRPDLL